MRTVLTRASLFLALLIAGVGVTAVPAQAVPLAPTPEQAVSVLAGPPAPAWDAEILASGCGSRCDFKPTSYNLCGTTCPDGIPIRCTNDQVIKDAAWYGNEWIELRYSPYCRTVWLRGNVFVNADQTRGASLTSFYNSACTNVRTTVYMTPFNGVRDSLMLNDANLFGQGQIYNAGNALAWTICY